MKNKLALTILTTSILIFSQEKNLLFEDKADAKDFKEFSQAELRTEVNLDSIAIVSFDDENEFLFSDEDEHLLNDVRSYSKPIFNSDLERNYYAWLRKKLHKAYPYYKQSALAYENISDSLHKFENDRKIKKYLKKRQEQLSDQYTTRLKNLTHTEGQILVLLMHRRTGKTTYEIVSELKSGWSAFWWEAAAGSANISLKREFDPDRVRMDYFLETLIIEGFRNKTLQDID